MQQDAGVHFRQHTADGIATFQSNLEALNAAANMHDASRESAAEAFDASSGDGGAWTYSSTCRDGALRAEGSATRHMMKGFINLPGVSAPAVFDGLARPGFLRSLLPATLASASVVGDDGKHVANSTEQQELWRVVLQLPFSWYAREISVWRVLRRRLGEGTYLMALRNGPLSKDVAAGSEGFFDAFRTGPKPAALIGCNGLLVTKLQGGAGARVCFVWCCELPGNWTSVQRLQATLKHFPLAARALVEKAQAEASADNKRRAELVDTTGDGRLDHLAIDTRGDGVVDTMIALEQLGDGRRNEAGDATVHVTGVSAAAPDGGVRSRKPSDAGTTGRSRAPSASSASAPAARQPPRSNQRARGKAPPPKGGVSARPQAHRSVRDDEGDQADFVSKAMHFLGIDNF